MRSPSRTRSTPRWSRPWSSRRWICPNWTWWWTRARTRAASWGSATLWRRRRGTTGEKAYLCTPVYTCVINGHHVALFSVSLFDLKSCQSTIAEYEKSENEIFLWQISKLIYLMIAMFEVFNSWRVAYLYQYCSRFLFHFVLITFLFIQRLEAYPERGGSLHILWKSKHWR